MVTPDGLDYMLFRYIIVGDVGVGKSCIMLQFTENKFRKDYKMTIGVEFGIKTIKIDNKNIKIQVWDTAGQENFLSITKLYYKGAVGALLVYDITDKLSFQNIANWLEAVRTNSSEQIVMIIIGNKNDLEQQ